MYVCTFIRRSESDSHQAYNRWVWVSWRSSSALYPETSRLFGSKKSPSVAHHRRVQEHTPHQKNRGYPVRFQTRSELMNARPGDARDAWILAHCSNALLVRSDMNLSRHMTAAAPTDRTFPVAMSWAWNRLNSRWICSAYHWAFGRSPMHFPSDRPPVYQYLTRCSALQGAL